MIVARYLLLLLVWCLVTPVKTEAAPTAVRVGYFPNITHGQALVGRAMGTFEKKVGPIEWKAFNAGPSAMEALLAGQLDLAFVGPNPAINAFMRSKGTSLRIVAGAASGGSGLVVDRQAAISGAQALKGKKIASPELGNTQDVALRHWLKANGLSAGRDVQVIPSKNPEILLLLKRRQIAGAWVPEPWLTRLIHEANGQLLIDERSLWPGNMFPTTILVARTAFLKQNRQVVQKFLEAHFEVTEWIVKHPAEARTTINRQLATLLGKPLPEKVVDEAFTRMKVTWDPLAGALLTSASWAGELGYLPKESVFPRSRLPEIFELGLLNELLHSRRLAPVKQ